eukprot:4531764-Prymnesium_polylepis.2
MTRLSRSTPSTPNLRSEATSPTPHRVPRPRWAVTAGLEAYMRTPRSTGRRASRSAPCRLCGPSLKHWPVLPPPRAAGITRCMSSIKTQRRLAGAGAWRRATMTWARWACGRPPRERIGAGTSWSSSDPSQSLCMAPTWAVSLGYPFSHPLPMWPSTVTRTSLTA